jgi:esterase/lipase
MMADYSHAIELVEHVQARDTAEVNPLCRSRLYTHEQKTDRAIVLLHGYTNNPRMFYKLGEELFTAGYNVWIPRMVYHGLLDRMTTEQAKLTAADMIAWTNEAVDIAQGLGHLVSVAGISMGGVMSGWAVQNRSDVSKAVMIASAFAMVRVPESLNTLIARLFLKLPNYFLWWDPQKKMAVGPDHAYPRFSTHPMAQIFLIGAELFQQARRAKPMGGSIVSVTNEKDKAVNNRVIDELGAFWRRNGAAIRTYEFKGEQVPAQHDIIDPDQALARTDVIYPVLLDLIVH